MQHPAYYIPTGDTPNPRLPESNIVFDASKDIKFNTTYFDDSDWPAAHVVSPEDAGWNKLIDRPIPMWKDYGLKQYTRTLRSDNQKLAYLPYNSHVTPYIKL